MNYQRCSYCVMDNKSDNTIVFDKDGRCNYCKEAEAEIGKVYFPDENGRKKLAELLETIKAEGKNKEYDCLMGISGGLDSSYLAYLGYKWGLRILAVHIDDGFDTEISKSNIDRLLKATGIKMLTVKPDAEQFNGLTKAFMKASVPDIAIPQDNVLFAFIYDTARKHDINYFLSGGNFALECILQKGNTHDAYDLVNIKDINKKFGNTSLNKLKFLSLYKKEFYKRILGLNNLRPLNYIDYNKDRAFKELYDFCGFEYYGSKHLENYFTMFAQLYWFPKKFGVDKRTSHLSSLIVSGQLTRQEAIKALEKPLYTAETMDKCINTLKDKLNISDTEFDEIMAAPAKQHNDYKVDKLAPFLLKVKEKLK